MRKKKGSEFPAGYKNPPRHTRFKPGQSGNPNGRPRKKVTLAESIERELNTRITVNEGGKQRRITKLDAIAKQQTNKAVNGDLKAAALLMKAIEPRESDTKDNLSPMLHAMRAIHAKHEVANRNGSSDVAGTLENDHKNSSNDPD